MWTRGTITFDSGTEVIRLVSACGGGKALSSFEQKRDAVRVAREEDGSSQFVLGDVVGRGEGGVHSSKSPWKHWSHLGGTYSNSHKSCHLILCPFCLLPHTTDEATLRKLERTLEPRFRGFFLTSPISSRFLTSLVWLWCPCGYLKLKLFFLRPFWLPQVTSSGNYPWIPYTPGHHAETFGNLPVGPRVPSHQILCIGISGR